MELLKKKPTQTNLTKASQTLDVLFVTTFASFRNIIDLFSTLSNKTWISISEKFGLLVPVILFYGKYINKIHVFRSVKKDRLGPVIWSTKEWVHGYLQ
jgi:abortive infection bacteriophage resistance protein